MQNTTNLPGLTVLLFFLLIYFVPGIVASVRSRQNAGAIWMLNLFLGWTLFGWVGALVWAMTTPESPAALGRSDSGR
ncbi:MAG: superinfection immunity protein [Rhodomicrobium sp.]